ncbi:uncharacterized protein LOC114737266 [Neltuma alba]|uniref:uncharacterized protein LOC114737266 n=1 Tax=Neltuma alba TaxID=207710 RepID=UPI0010A3BFCD|nr:uncharacterized protein LOC114737266 [Prosopis alba]
MAEFRFVSEMEALDLMMSKGMELRFAVKNRKWNHVVEIYNDPEVQKSRINRWGDTALRAAIETEDTTTVKLLIDAIKFQQRGDDEALDILSLKNDTGNTPLHCAASPFLICVAIITMLHKSLILGCVITTERLLSSWLHALQDHRQAFLVLHRAAGEDSPLHWRRNNSDTILHCTIRRGYFGTDTNAGLMPAYFVNEPNCEGETPRMIFEKEHGRMLKGVMTAKRANQL